MALHSVSLSSIDINRRFMSLSRDDKDEFLARYVTLLSLERRN